MSNNKDIQENRHVIGYINPMSAISVATQEKRLELHEVSRVYYKWSDIESNAVREKDTLFVYDLNILGATRKIMSQRIEYLMQRRITIQLSTGNQKVSQLPDWEGQYATHMAHVRANSFFRKDQGKTARSKRGGKSPKIKQPLSDRILVSYYLKQKGELGHESVKDTAKRLGTDTAAYYKYLDRFLIAIANGEASSPQEFSEPLTTKVRRLRKIVYKRGKWIKLKK